jgi:hypothetical protein
MSPSVGFKVCSGTGWSASCRTPGKRCSRRCRRIARASRPIQRSTSAGSNSGSLGLGATIGGRGARGTTMRRCYRASARRQVPGVSCRDLRCGSLRHGDSRRRGQRCAIQLSNSPRLRLRLRRARPRLSAHPRIPTFLPHPVRSASKKRVSKDRAGDVRHLLGLALRDSASRFLRVRVSGLDARHRPVFVPAPGLAGRLVRFSRRSVRNAGR